MRDTTARERARLVAAEDEVLRHYGLEATNEPLALRDPELTTRVLRLGEGPPTVLLHGGNMTSTVWAPLLPHLRDRSLYLVDLPGCGLADPFDYAGVDVTALQQAFVGSVLDALGLRRAALVGASLGGMFALRFALEHPERTVALALLSAPAFALPGARLPLTMALASRPRLGRLLQRLTPSPSASMMKRMLATIGGRDAVRDVPEAMFEALGAAMALAGPSSASMGPATFRWRTPLAHLPVTDAELAGCHVPVLFVWGERDKVQAPAAGSRAVEVLPHARIEILPGGHGIWFEQPGRCGALLTGHLQDAEREDADREPTA